MVSYAILVNFASNFDGFLRKLNANSCRFFRRYHLIFDELLEEISNRILMQFQESLSRDFFVGF